MMIILCDGVYIPSENWIFCDYLFNQKGGIAKNIK